MSKFMEHFSIWHSIIIAIIGGVLIIFIQGYNIWPLTIMIYLILGLGFIFMGYNVTNILMKRENLRNKTLLRIIDNVCEYKLCSNIHKVRHK